MSCVLQQLEPRPFVYFLFVDLRRLSLFLIHLLAEVNQRAKEPALGGDEDCLVFRKSKNILLSSAVW